jgi:hypothetical protein
MRVKFPGFPPIPLQAKFMVIGRNRKRVKLKVEYFEFLFDPDHRSNQN